MKNPLNDLTSKVTDDGINLTHQLNSGFDRNRRLALKMLGGTAVIATGAAYSSAYALDTLATEDEKRTNVIRHRSPGAELTISLSVDPQPTIRITNHSDRLIIVRHVYPGIIHAGAQTFDINSTFERSAYAVGAGRSRLVAVEETTALQAEREYPRHLYANKPQRIVAVTGRNNAGQLANSTRSFFA